MTGDKDNADVNRHNDAWQVFTGHDNAATVRDGFWPKMAKLAARIPFAEEVLAAWYCASDAATPARVKAILLAALAYFVVPIDLIPDMIPGLGFTDDLTVLVTSIGLIRAHMKPQHREQARKALEDLKAGRKPQSGQI